MNKTIVMHLLGCFGGGLVGLAVALGGLVGATVASVGAGTVFASGYICRGARDE